MDLTKKSDSDKPRLETHDARAVTVTNQPAQLSRSGIAPDIVYNKQAGEVDIWQVKTTLLPSASWTRCPDKSTNQYWRLKSRQMIVSTIIQGRDSKSIAFQISKLFNAALCGRGWVPLQTMKHIKTSEIHLRPLSALDSIRDKDFNFLADKCLLQSEKGTLKLFIAPASGSLSWETIRRLPRPLQGLRRHSKPQMEDFWTSDDGNGDPSDDAALLSKDKESVYSLQPMSHDSTVATNFAAHRKDPPQSAANSSGMAAVVTAKASDKKKGKFPCPHTDCHRSRFPFQYQDGLAEHIQGRHLGIVPSVGAAAVADEKPGAGSENVTSLESITLETIAPPVPVSESLGRRKEKLLPMREATTPPKNREKSRAEPSQQITRTHSATQDPSSKQCLDDKHSNSQNLMQRVKDMGRVTKGKEEKLKSEILLVPWPPNIMSLPFRPRYHTLTGGDSGGRNSPPIHQSESGDGKRRRDPNKRRRTEKNDDTGGSPEDESDESDDDEARPAVLGTRATDRLPVLYACPFRKHSLKDYGWRDLCKKGWKEVRRVKEHIYRAHLLPEVFQCRRCKTDFKDQDSLDEHAEAPEPCQPSHTSSNPKTDMIVTRRQETQLKGRKKGQPEPQRWRDMFKILFPDILDKDIPSPWVQQSLDIEEYRSFLTGQLPRQFREEIRLRVAEDLLDENSSHDNQSVLVDRITNIIETTQSQILEHFLLSRCESTKMSEDHSEPDLGQPTAGEPQVPEIQVTPIKSTNLPGTSVAAFSSIDLPAELPVPAASLTGHNSCPPMLHTSVEYNLQTIQVDPRTQFWMMGIDQTLSFEEDDLWLDPDANNSFANVMDEFEFYRNYSTRN